MSQHAFRAIGLAILWTCTGCVYIPTWDWPQLECCQCAEDTWGDAVDCVNHQSTIDQPCHCHDLDYCKRGVYRVAAPGTVVILSTEEYEQPTTNAPPVLTPPPTPADERSGYLKP
jgi:hypothetical protein